MKRENIKKYGIVTVSFAIPFIICFLYCLIRGVALTELYIPAAYNNDCVFYYKLVDAIVTKGGPTGYFGFNESRAIFGGFAAWSPLIVFPWVIWGLIFGWNYTSALVCNIVLFSIAFALFAYLTEIDLKELFVLSLALFLFPSFSIHMFNMLPEITIASLILIYLGLAIRFSFKETKMGYIVALFAIGAYLTIVRPYMVLLVLFPTFYLSNIKGKSRAIISFVMVSGFSLAMYWVIGKYFTSAYFNSLFNTDILSKIIHLNIKEAFWMSVYIFRDMCTGIWNAIVGAFSYGLTMGISYLMALVTAIITFIIGIKAREKRIRYLYLFYSFTVVCMLLAIVFFLQKTNEGGRHIWVFAFMGIILCCTGGFNIKGIVMKGIPIVLLLVMCFRGSMVPTDYDIPIGNKEVKSNLEYWEPIFEEETVFDTNQKGYDNTLLWVFVDYAKGNQVVTNYSELYALPAGTGISCCYPDYVIENFENLQCKYIITYSGGSVAEMCLQKNLSVVGEYDDTILFRLTD